MKAAKTKRSKGRKAKPEPKKTRGAAAVFACALAALLIGLTLRTFAFTLVAVRSEGMRGTLQPGDVVLVARSAKPERGRVVLAGASNGSVLRRVIGEPGDTVRVVDGAAYVNGMPLHEPYRTGAAASDPPETRLSAGVYLLMPDDRSWECALVEEGGIAGTALAVIWPLSRAGFL